MSTNDITGDQLISKPATDVYRSNYDTIFGKNHSFYVDSIEDKEAVEQFLKTNKINYAWIDSKSIFMVRKCKREQLSQIDHLISFEGDIF